MRAQHQQTSSRPVLEKSINGVTMPSHCFCCCFTEVRESSPEGALALFFFLTNKTSEESPLLFIVWFSFTDISHSNAGIANVYFVILHSYILLAFTVLPFVWILSCCKKRRQKRLLTVC